VEFKDFSFIYGDDLTQQPAISDISFQLKKGEYLILAGPSGSGKSTLTNAINGIIPFRLKGYMKGTTHILGKNVENYDFMELSRNVGLVKQNPLEQLVTFTVRDEIAFGLENLKYSKEEIKNRVEEIANLMEIKHLLDRTIDQLSGGQKQIVILSSFLVMNPKILILDEPIAFLDQNSESLLLNRLKRLKKSNDFNLTIIIVEHRLSRVIDLADKILILNEEGKIALYGDISEIIEKKFTILKSCNVRVPWILDLFFKFKNLNDPSKKFVPPKNFQDLLTLLHFLNKNELYSLKELLIDTEIEPIHLKSFENYEEKIHFNNLYIESLKQVEIIRDSPKLEQKKELGTILEVQNLIFEYPNTQIKAINNLSLKIKEGDFIGLIGPNGSGKTTLLYLLANLYEPKSGEILFKGKNLKDLDIYDYAQKIGFIFQNPENMIFKSTIKKEILYGPENFGISDKIDDIYLKKLIQLIGNEDEEKNPFNLSWGQKRRLNLSSIFIYNPDIILLDEPFIGQDQKTIDSLIETLFIENKRGKTIIISSHDYHLLLKYTRRIIELNRDGTLKDDKPNKEFFSHHKNLGPVILLDEINKNINKS